MVELLGLAAIAAVGQIAWFVSAEAASILYVRQLGWHPVAVGAVCAGSQVAVHALLYAGGTGLVSRWGRLHRAVERTRERFRSHLEERYLAFSFLAAVVGIPPVMAMAALAGGFGVPARRLLPVTGAGRMVRFTAIAFAGVGLPGLAW
jgi:hypothetical protein